MFGVKFALDQHGNLAIEPEGTAACRDQMRRERLEHARPAEMEAPSVLITKLVLSLSDNLAIGHDEKGDMYYCSAVVKRALTPVGRSYKEACRRLDLALTEVNPLVGDPHEFIDDNLQFRLFVCPYSGVLIETEIARSVDEPLVDVAIDLDDLRRLSANRVALANATG